MAKTPCFDTDLLKKKIPFTPEQRASIWKILREDYFHHGVPFEKAVRAFANDVGWHPEAIIQAIADPKSTINPRRQTAGLWQRSARDRAIRMQAQDLVGKARSGSKLPPDASFRMIMEKGSPLEKAEAIWNAQRDLSVWGHFGVFGGTHMKSSILIPSEWENLGRVYKNSFSLIKGDYQAWHEYNRFLMESDPYWARSGKNGLDNNLAELPVGIVSGRMKRSAAAFDYIKQERTNISKRWAETLPDQEQKIVNQFINHATGSVHQSRGLTRVLGFFQFAPKLLYGQLQEAYLDPLRAIYYLGKGDKATSGQRASRNYVFSRMGQLAAVQTALLGANYVAGQFLGDNWKPNLTDPKRANWLRVKIAGHSVILSPMMEWLKFPFRMMDKAMNSNDPIGAVAKDAFQTLLIYRSNPMIGNVLQLLFGEEPATGRPTPFPGLVRTPKPSKSPYKQPIGYTEFLSQRLPIPYAAGAREFYDSMRTEGLDHQTAKSWVEFAIGTAVGSLGFHERTEEPPKISTRPQTSRANPGVIPKLFGARPNSGKPLSDRQLERMLNQ